MDFTALGIGLMAFGMLGAALGVASIFSALLNGISRNPSAEKQLSKYAFIGAGMAEAMGLFALVISFMLLNQ
ncbi:MAG: F0F1 ATP synthase subunit C [Rickettsiales bacterium]|nr:F0F1 ATP synthase subunit C [Rickettsiales bacterium]